MKNKIISGIGLLVLFVFIGVDRVNAHTLLLPTNTGSVYLTAELSGYITINPTTGNPLYAPGSSIEAEVALDLGFAAPTDVSVTGSANGGSGLFSGLSSYPQKKFIGTAPNPPGTYNANFSYSYNQAPLGDIDAYLSVYAGYPTFGNRRCFLRVDLSSPASQSISIGASLTTSIQDLYDLRGFSFTDSVTVPSGLTISETDLGPCNNFGDLNMFPRLNPFHTTLNDGRSVYVEHGPNLWL